VARGKFRPVRCISPEILADIVGMYCHWIWDAAIQKNRCLYCGMITDGIPIRTCSWQQNEEQLKQFSEKHPCKGCGKKETP
jgi:hypothetical protein